MKVRTKVQKWGNGLAIRLSGPLRDIPHFKEGTPLEINVTEAGLEIKKVKHVRSKLLPFTEAELVKDLSPENAHIDLVTNLLKNEY